MNAVLRRRLERAARVRDFIRAPKTDGAGEGTAAARPEEPLQRAEAAPAPQRGGGGRARVGGSADLQAVITEVTEQVRVLDGLVRYRFSDNAELRGAWASAGDVLGPFRPRSEPPAQPANEGQTPAGPDAVKSAA